MNKTINKIALVGVALASCSLTASAVSYEEQPVISGWNLLVTNSSGGAIVGATNNLFTAYSGLVEYSLTNNLGNTNVTWPDAFVPGGISLKPDSNGDYISSNACFHYLLGNTNLIPLVTTNSYGQYVVSNSWPLISSGNPTYMPSANTNYYPVTGFALPSTNIVNFNLQRGWSYPIGGSSYTVWDVTNGYTVSVPYTNATAGVPPIVSGSVLLPISFVSGANKFRLYSVTLTPNPDTTAAATNEILVNAVSIGQPIP